MFSMRLNHVVLVLALFFSGLTDRALALSLPHIFASHMVLQRDMPVRVWGKAQANSTVFVFFQKQRSITVADNKGDWATWLQPLEANATGQTLTVLGDGIEIKFEDVLVGEVWLCSGQSNMEYPVRGLKEIDTLIAEASDAQLRLCEVGRNYAATPQSDTYIRWAVSEGKTIPGFSAVGYYFGKFLRQELGVPVGLIRAAWGGTPCEAWTSAKALNANPKLESVKQLWQKQVDSYDQRLAKWKVASQKAYEKQVQWLKDHPDEDPQIAQKKFRIPRQPFAPDATPFAPSVLFNGMISPVFPMSMRGAIWYQGEANGGRPDEYRTLLPTMIQDWRARLFPNKLHFGIVQLANWRPPLDHSQPPEDAGWAHLRDAQKYTAELMPNVGMATIIDIGEKFDIHPKNKRDVGKRLSLWALHDVYGKAVRHTGPVFDTYEIKDGRIFLIFNQVGSGLTTSDGKPITECIIADEDRKWHWAQAKITSRNTLEVWADAVPNPIAVRYAWASNPDQANLTNDIGLPASPFRTDDWLFGH
ncbi:MAG: sialate O-acetylesterase [Phycisphaeraceae bacterium JB051]